MEKINGQNILLFKIAAISEDAKALLGIIFVEKDRSSYHLDSFVCGSN